MTLSDLRTQVEIETDNEFDEDLNFIVSLNNVLIDINGFCGTLFKTLSLDENDVQTYLTSTDEWHTLLGIPAYTLPAILMGLKWQILDIEQEDDRFAYKEDFGHEKVLLMTRMPIDHSQRSAYKTNSYILEIDWEE